MKLRAISLGILALTVCNASAIDNAADNSIQASFDCKKAKTPVEKTICQNDRLKRKDAELAEAYKKVLDSIESSEQRREFQGEEREWLARRALACGLQSDPSLPRRVDVDDPETCLHEFYEHRINELKDGKRPNAGIVSFSPRHYPFVPKLLASKNPNVCHSFEAAVQQDFMSRNQSRYRYHTTYGWGALMPGTFRVKGGVWLPDEARVFYVPRQGNQGPMSVFINQYGGIHGSFQISLYTKPGMATEEEVGEIPSSFPHGDVFKSKHLHPAFEQRSTSDSPFHLLWINGALYLYRNGSEKSDGLENGDDDLPNNAVGLYLIVPDGDLQTTCVVSAAPETDVAIASPPYFRSSDYVPSETSPVIKTPQALKAFFDATDAAAGQSLDSQPCEGTDGPYVWAHYYTNRGYARYTALVRPWMLAVKISKDNRIAFFNRWGISSLYDYRIYERIMDAKPKAIEALSAFYQEQYGLASGEAQNAAEAVIEQILDASLTGSSIVDPELSEYIESGDSTDSFRQRYREALASDTLSARQLRRAVLTGMADLIKDTPAKVFLNLEAPAKTSDDDGPEQGEPLLFYALDNQEMLNLLLSKELDVNKPNWFGKTALMYAAQWNLPKVIRTLLDRHADVNIATPPPAKHNCSGAPHIKRRTALMYAAENASMPVIQMLLKAGADKKAKDNEGKGITDYLARNAVLSKDERLQIGKSLQ